MQIRKLNFVAFGLFSGRTLLFDQGACMDAGGQPMPGAVAEVGGLHIVYGPNEAGKSSALRGLQALLYNIDERTTDNFLHANDKLRIEGCVRAANGGELSFVRRKGRKNTLLSMEGESLDDTALTPFLQGVTPELFEMFFGIDHHALIQGGQDILEQKGEVGQALFSASLGSHALHAVLGELDDEADKLFRPRGSTQTINSALKVFTDLNKQIRDRSLSSRRWDEHRRALARTTKDLEHIHSILANKRIEVTRMKRIQRVLPKLARWHELLRKREALGEVIVVAQNFAERRLKAFTEREKAQESMQKATSRLDGLQGQLAELCVRWEVLQQSENIEALHARLGGHRKAIQDRPQLKAEQQQLRTDGQSLLKDVRADLSLADIEVLRPVFAKRQRISELATRNPVLVSCVQQAKSNLRETQIRLQEANLERHNLAQIDSPEVLRRSIVMARKLGNVDSSIQSDRSKLKALQEQCSAELARLTLWSGSLEDVPGLSVPTQDNINWFEQAYAEIDKSVQRLQEKQVETLEYLREASRRLDELQRAGTVPSEQELIALRTQREQAWQLLRRQWLDGEDVATQASVIDSERTLADAFEYRVISTDKLADRLRREAERVHTMASLLAEQETRQQRAGEIAQQLDKCAQKKKQIDSDWQVLWRPSEIQPRTPREMRAWLDNLDRLRNRVGQQLNALRQQLSEQVHTRDTQIQQLTQQLRNLGKKCTDTLSLEAVLLEGDEIVGELEGKQRQQEALDKEIKALERNQVSERTQCQSARDELEQWQVQWQAVVEGVGLQGNALPSEAADVIDKIRELFTKHSAAQKLQIRIQSIDEDAESFSAQTGRVVASVAAEFAKLSAEDAVMHLNTLLLDSRTRQSRSQQIEEQVQQARQDIQDGDATIHTTAERLDALCVEAECASHTQLEEAERSSAECLRVKAEVSHVEQELLDDGEGATLAELEEEAKDVDADALPGQLKALSNEIDEELEPKRTQLAQNKGREEKEIELMDGSDHAAELAEQGQCVLASIRTNAEQYVRLKLAARILRDQIEHFRKDNQGPLLKRASEHFAMLTSGSFAELRTDFNEKDEPVLVGIRPTGDRVHVEGMSNGTRDQLYLALRLASLEKFMENSEPMPFIVDDILVDFDDERSEAALNALAKLAKKTQVIVFTHHSRVVEQAKKIPGAVQVHDL